MAKVKKWSGTAWVGFDSETVDGKSVLSGSSTFNSTTGVQITHNLGTTTYQVQITPTTDPGGTLGEFWVVKGANILTVYNSGSTTTAPFDWCIIC